MNINFARFVDFWIGQPICFVLSLMNRLLKRDTNKKGNPRKIMFLELSEMGSAILSYPAIKKAKEIYPDAEIFFWIFERNQESVHLLSIIPKSNVITMRDESPWMLVCDVMQNLRRIRREKMDTVIDMELFSRFSSILTYLTGASSRVGFHKYSMEGLYRGQMHTHKAVYNPYQHMAMNYLSLVHALKATDGDGPIPKTKIEVPAPCLPQITPGVEAKNRIRRVLKDAAREMRADSKIVVISPGSSQLLPLRKWPIENYLKLVKRLTEDEKVLIVIIGLEEDRPYASRIVGEIGENQVVDLTGKTTFHDLVELLAVANLLIGHDGGPPNFAALTQTKAIVLFGPETPTLYAPLNTNQTILYANYACSPCVSAYNHRKSLCKDNRCLKAIRVIEVLDAAKRYLYP